MIKYCSYCRKPFQLPSSSHRKICSTECFQKSRADKYIKDKCPICGAKYKRLKSRLGEHITCENKNCVERYRAIVLNFHINREDLLKLSNKNRIKKILEFESIIWNKKNKQCNVCKKWFVVGRNNQHGKTCSKQCSRVLRSTGATKSNIERYKKQCENRFKPRILINLIANNFIHCIKCKKSFKTEFNLNQHYILAHNKQKSICNICGREFESLKSLVGHVVEMHKISIDKFYVDYLFSGIAPKCKCGCGKLVTRIGAVYRKYIRGHAPLKNQRSNIENVFYRFLKNMFVSVSRQYRVNKKWPVDFYIRDIDTFIEFDGIFWHGKITPRVIIDNNIKYEGVKRRVQSDLNENQWFRNNSLNLLRITDKDFVYNNFNFDLISGCDRISDIVIESGLKFENVFVEMKRKGHRSLLISDIKKRYETY